MYKIAKKIEKTDDGYVAELKCVEADTKRDFCVYGDECIFYVPSGFWGPYYSRICVTGKDMKELEEKVDVEMKKVQQTIENRRATKFETIEI